MIARLTIRTLARHKGLIAGMAAVLAGFQVLLVVIAANLQREGLFSQLAALVPSNIQAALGGSLIASFGGLLAFGFFHPVVVLGLAVGASYLGSELAGDVETGLVDLVAARPVPRAALVARTLVAIVAASTTIVGLMVVASRASALAVGGAADTPVSATVALAVNLLAVTWCCGAAGLAIAAVTRSRAAAAGAAALVFISTYLVNFAAAWWRPARFAARFTPFHYFDAMPIVLGTHDPARDILVLLSASALLVVAALVSYQRRDL